MIVEKKRGFDTETIQK